jgi:NAD(P)-dependent dehydrogenase (short-subunit alcohol dehydrogenase family)
VMRNILLCAIGVPEAELLAPALEAAGVSVRLITSIDAATDAAAGTPPDAIVIALGNASGAVCRPIGEWSLAEWMAAADAPIFDLLDLLQKLKLATGTQVMPIVLIGPDLGQTGAAGHVALAAAAEGQRGLMKSLARQWGPGIRFAWAGVWPALLFPQIDPASLPEQPELGAYTPPLGGRPDWEKVATAVLALVALGGAATGQSVIVDGGEWMLP